MGEQQEDEGDDAGDMALDGDEEGQMAQEEEEPEEEEGEEAMADEEGAMADEEERPQEMADGEHHQPMADADDLPTGIGQQGKDFVRYVLATGMISDVVVAQSCEVALDAADYFGRASFAQEKAGHFNLAGALGDLAVAASGD